MSNSSKSRTGLSLEGIWEFFLTAVTIPAVIYGAMSLNSLPVV